jgi:hypothetical protein
MKSGSGELLPTAFGAIETYLLHSALGVRNVGYLASSNMPMAWRRDHVPSVSHPAGHPRLRHCRPSTVGFCSLASIALRVGLGWLLFRDGLRDGLKRRSGC